jgi:serine/threonine protein kinase
MPSSIVHSDCWAGSCHHHTRLCETGIELVSNHVSPHGFSSKRRELLNQRLCAQHPHIVHLREAFLTPGHLGISMEYATSGDLLDYVEAHMAHVIQLLLFVIRVPHNGILSDVVTMLMPPWRPGR